MSDVGPFAQLAAAMASDWRRTARPDQLAPPGDWTIWAILAGRGWGKTRTGAEWVIAQVRAGKKRIALVGGTASDVRAVMVEGQSGILSCSPAGNRPTYEPSRRQLTWPNGAIALCYSADEPDRLRGPQHDAAWVDELAAFSQAETWDQLMFGLRLGTHPQAVVTTTPRPNKIIKDLIARHGKDVVVTRGRTYDNTSNLAPTFINTIIGKYEGTRLGRQELNGEILSDTPGALWQRDWLERDRVELLPQLRRIVVAIDPATTVGEDSDETGIVVAGRDANGHGYVLADLSGKYGPMDWAAKAIKGYRDWGADRIVAETNQGGLMVENTLRMVDASVPYRGVHASRGKVTRAEPVSALFEQGKVHMLDFKQELEDQLCEFTADFSKSKMGYSPDRVDALVYAITELCVDYQPKRAKTFNLSVMNR